MKNFDLISTILGGCQSIVELNKKLVGDPVELLFFENSDWNFNYGSKEATHKKEKGKIVRVRNIFYFNSSLKRMSTVVFTNGMDISGNKDFLVTKGAPEVVGKLLKEKPSHYDDWSKNLAIKGYRILSLAYKPLDKKDVKNENRNELEKNLIFAGFLILKNNLKKDTKKYIQHIQKADRNIVVLTGDHLLTSISSY